MRTFNLITFFTAILVLFFLNGISQRTSNITKESIRINNQNSLNNIKRSIKSSGNHTLQNRSLPFTKSNNSSLSKGEIDTLNYPLAGEYAFYVSNEGGYVSGNNVYGDLSKANVFTINEPKMITGILIDFAIATGNSEIEISIWDNSGTNSSPGNQISSTFISTSDIINDIQNNLTSFIEFNQPAIVFDNFYAGVKLPTAVGDTIVIWTNTDGDTNPATAWDQWSDNSWVPYNISWELNVAHAIFPIIDNEIGLLADFSSNINSILPNQSVDFYDNSIGTPVSWEWTFEGGNPATSTEQNPVIIYSNTGMFDVSLKIIDGGNSDSITKVDYIIVNEEPILTANFSASSTVLTLGQTIQFNDNSLGNPTFWEWTFEGGDPETSTEQYPEVYYSETGWFDVSLKISNVTYIDSITKVDYILVTTHPAPEVDTLNYPLEGDFAFYVIDNYVGGYVCGNNKFGDLAKANYFDNTEILEITGILFDFYLAKGGNPNIQIGIWDNDGLDNSPGTLLGNENITLNEIKLNINSQQLSFVEFNNPITINNSFYAGFMLPSTAGDTLVVWSNEDGNTNPGIAWDKWENNTWHPFSNTWQLNLAMGIHPIVDYSVGINDRIDLNKISIFPNPTEGVIHLETFMLSKDAQMKIFNSSGILIYKSNLNSYDQDYKVDLTGFEDGMYIISVTSGQETFFNKVIKN